MGKVIEKVKFTSLFDSTKTREVEAAIDTGAMMPVLPRNRRAWLNNIIKLLFKRNLLVSYFIIVYVITWTLLLPIITHYF